MSAMVTATVAPAMPYPGLRPFEAADQPVFFGREAQVSGMLRQLEDHRFVAVVGASGSGKSSLVRAGLLPAVSEGFLLGTTDWITLVIRPGNQPYGNLAGALSAVTPATGADASSSSASAALKDTLSTLRRSDRGLLTLLESSALSPETRLMLVVDQFEELFAFRRASDGDAGVTSRDEAAAFVKLLLQSCSGTNGRVWVVLTMRSDFIGDCEAFLGLPEQVSQSQFLVPRLDRAQMEEAITRPASADGAGYTPFGFEAGVANRIINDAGDRPDQLPLMQHALMRMWKLAKERSAIDGGSLQLTHADYDRAGGIEHALSLDADAAWNEVRGDQRKARITRQMLLLLCDVSADGQITRRRPHLREVMAATGGTEQEIDEIVAVFQRDHRNFLVRSLASAADADVYLDVSHEALLRRWRLFATDWLEQERHDVAELRRLVELAGLQRQDQGSLLQAQDLERVSRWRQRVSAEWAQRYVSPDRWHEALAFVDLSRADLERRRTEETARLARQTRRNRLAVAAVIASLLAGVIAAVWLMVRAQRAQSSAQEALTRSFQRTIATALSREAAAAETDALWELAALDRSNTTVRENVIDYWTGDAINRASANNGRALHAAIGTRADLHNRAMTRLTALADQRLSALATAANGSTSEFSAAAANLPAVVSQMPPAEASRITARSFESLPAAFAHSKPFDNEWTQVGSVFSDLAVRLQPSDATRATRTVREILERLPAKKTPNEKALVQILSVTVPRSDTAAIAGLAAVSMRLGLDRASGGPSSFDPGYPDFLREVERSLVALVPSLDDPAAAGVAKQVAADLDAADAADPAAVRTSEWRQLPVQLLVALAPRLDTAAAGAVASQLLRALEMAGPIDMRYRFDRIEPLKAVAARLAPPDAAAAGEQVLGLLARDSMAPATDRLAEVLAVLTARMAPTDAARVSARGAAVVVNAMPNVQPGMSFGNLAKTLALLTTRMEADAALPVIARVAPLVVEGIERIQLSNDDTAASFAYADMLEALNTLAARMDSSTAAALIDRLMPGLIAGSDRFIKVLPALGHRLEAADAQRVASALADSMNGAAAARLTTLASNFSELTAQMDQQVVAAPARRAAESVVVAIERAPPPAAAGTKSPPAPTLIDLAASLVSLTSRLDRQAPDSAAARGARAIASQIAEGRVSNPVAVRLAASLAALGHPLEAGQLERLAARAALDVLGQDDKPFAGSPLLVDLSRQLPSARLTRLLALSGLLTPAQYSDAWASSSRDDDPIRTEARAVTAMLSRQDLADVLKWPFCVGQARLMVLQALEKQTGATFEGSLWKFVDAAPASGIGHLEDPAIRPTPAAARNELRAIAGGG